MSNSTTTPKPSLFERLGGEANVRKIVNDVLDKNSGNPLIAHHFSNIDMKNLKQKAFEFFSKGTGGPHQYTGRDMKTAHANMNISICNIHHAFLRWCRQYRFLRNSCKEKTTKYD